MTTKEPEVRFELDVSDCQNWVGIPQDRTRTAEPIAEKDIVRWCQAMQAHQVQHPNPLPLNPLHTDRAYAARSKYGGIIAPTSFQYCLDMGATPAIFGYVKDSHMLFGGDEWWFFGPIIRPGDVITMFHMPFDYRVTETAFAGPTLFQRGDTIRINQRGEIISLQRSTSIRYSAEAARARRAFTGKEAEPTWSAEELARIAEFQRNYRRRGAEPRYYEDVQVGEEMPPKVIGPHSLLTFTVEAFAYNIPKEHLGGKNGVAECGWTSTMADGAAKGHTRPEYARYIGMPRGYGYGASMGAWILDYIEDWAGDDSFIKYERHRLRNPALSGDVTWLRGKVAKKGPDREGQQVVTVEITMTNQLDEVLATGQADVVLPMRG